MKDDAVFLGSNPSLYSNDSHERKSENKAREDLYSWMAKQNPITKVSQKCSDKPPIEPNVEAQPNSATTQLNAQPNHYQYTVQDSLTLLDAHLIFKPFLSSLGLASHQVNQGIYISCQVLVTLSKDVKIFHF